MARASATSKKPAKKKRPSPAKPRPAVDRWRPLWQILLLGGVFGSGYAAVALVSYHPTDPAFSRSTGGAVENAAGPVGAVVADLLLQVLGYGGFLVPLLGVAFALRLAGRRVASLLQALAATTLLWVLLCALALVFPPELSDAFPAGGVTGEATAALVTGFVGPVGVWIVLLAVAMVAVTFLGRVDWETLAGRAVDNAEAALPVVGSAGAEAGRRAVDGLRNQWDGFLADRRERRAARAARRAELTEYADTGSIYTTDPSLYERAPAALVPEPAVYDEERRADTVSEERGGIQAIDFSSEPLYRPTLPRAEARPTANGGLARDTRVGGRELVEVEYVPTSADPIPQLTHRDEAPRNLRAEFHHHDDGAVSRLPSRNLPDPTDLPVPGGLPAVHPSTGSAAAEEEAFVDVPDDLFGAAPARPSVAPSEPAVPAGVAHAMATPSADAALPAASAAPEAAPVAAPAPAPTPRPRAVSAIQVDPQALVSGGQGDDGLAVIDRGDDTSFELPHLGLLDEHERSVAQIDEIELRALADTLEQKLGDFGVRGEVTAIRPGPVITTFEYLPAAGIKLSKISALEDDIAMALKALRVRIVAPIPGKGVVGFEVPNMKRQTVWIRDLLASEGFRRSSAPLPMVLGKSVEGKPHLANLVKAPHLLVAGTTGSGKSVGVNCMLLSMLFTRTPEELKLLLIDPKMLEFELYREIPHLIHPVVTDPALANAALKWACQEMDDRYRILARWKTRNIASYNQKVDKELENWTPEKAWKFAPRDWSEDTPPPPPRKLPYLVIVIDELADLMMVAAKEVETSIARIAQKARAAGIHLIVATQRPEKTVVTGIIKANMPSRIAFQVRSRLDGRIILDQNGAENLLGKGDMLFLPPGVAELVRCHGAFVSDDEVRAVCDFLRDQGAPNYEAQIRVDDDADGEMDPEDYDELYDQACAYVVKAGKASTSMVQREFKIGYNRAARMIEVMEREGLVGPADGARPRKVLVPH